MNVRMGLLFAVALAALQCGKKPAGQANAGKVTAADLVGKTWGGTGPGARHHFEVSFTEKNVKFETNAEGTACGIADYTISGSSIEISKTRPCPNVETYVVDRELPAQKCEYVVDEAAIDHVVTLRCPTFMLGRHDSLVPAGRKIRYEGVDLISEGHVGAETVTAAKFRSRPEKSAPTIAYDPGNEIEGSKPKTDVIAAGTYLMVIGRTVNKHQVEKWENYWYLVHVYGTETYRGWVFGELLKKK